LRAFNSWSPRKTKATMSVGPVPSTTRVFTQSAASTPRNSLSWAIVRAFGVSTFVSG
jgi:hypothetical protein